MAAVAEAEADAAAVGEVLEVPLAVSVRRRADAPAVALHPAAAVPRHRPYPGAAQIQVSPQILAALPSPDAVPVPQDHPALTASDASAVLPPAAAPLRPSPDADHPDRPVLPSVADRRSVDLVEFLPDFAPLPQPLSVPKPEPEVAHCKPVADPSAA